MLRDVIEIATPSGEAVRLRAAPTYVDGVVGDLPPIRLRVESRHVTVQEYLTADQAADLGNLLLTLALKIEAEDTWVPTEDGSVMAASGQLVDAAARFDAALGDSRR